VLATHVVSYTTVGTGVNGFVMDVHGEMDGRGMFEVCSINDLLTRTTHRPRALFGDLWLEGEISVMFAEAGCGKSVLAVQIAESIARGQRLKPMFEAPKKQKVVYLDLESLPEHFCRRYRHDDDGRNFGPYKFPANLVLCRQVLDREPDIDAIEGMLKAADGRVLIIDNIAHLMKNRSSREAERVMRELRRLNRAEGISILLLAHSAAASLRRGIEACDVPFASVMNSLADNIFAIGCVGGDPSGRYIKHIRPGAAAHTFGTAHVPWFRIKKRANFTYFDFRGFAREGALRVSDNDRREWQIVDRIHELKSSGMSVRDIARVMEMSKSTVHRYLTMIDDDEGFARPTAPPAAPVQRVYRDPIQQGFAEQYQKKEEEGDTGLWLPELEDLPAAHESDGPWEPIPAFLIPNKTPASDDPAAGPHALLERDLDDDGREIFVEQRDAKGRHTVWYRPLTDRHGPTGKWERFEHRHGERIWVRS
jgi:hypothetical protein